MRKNTITFLWHVASCRPVHWQKYFKWTCCLHFQGRRRKLSRREIYITQGMDCRHRDLSSMMEAYILYLEGTGSRFLQMLASIYRNTQYYTSEDLSLNVLTATKHQFSHDIWLVFTLWFHAHGKPAQYHVTGVAQSFASALVSSNSEKPQYCKTRTYLSEE
jgi:hypothetical protein